MTLNDLIPRAAIDSEDIVRLTHAHSWLQRALAVENHGAIAHFDAEVKFWGALICAKLCDAALAAGDLTLAKTLHGWAAQRRVPENEKARLINSVLGL